MLLNSIFAVDSIETGEKAKYLMKLLEINSVATRDFALRDIIA
jgi:hypothetical protein